MAFTQHLLQLHLATSTIRNIISALRTMFRWHGVNAHLWQSDSWEWNLKSLTLANRAPPRLQSVVSFPAFLKAIWLAEQRHWHHVKLSLILGFLGLLRISNIAPNSSYLVDPTRTTLLQDIRVVDNTLVVNIKWAKNLQTGSEVLKIPASNTHYSVQYARGSTTGASIWDQT